jgi:hypothetical protein
VSDAEVRKAWEEGQVGPVDGIGHPRAEPSAEQYLFPTVQRQSGQHDSTPNGGGVVGVSATVIQPLCAAT